MICLAVTCYGDDKEAIVLLLSDRRHKNLLVIICVRSWGIWYEGSIDKTLGFVLLALCKCAVVYLNSDNGILTHLLQTRGYSVVIVFTVSISVLVIPWNGYGCECCSSPSHHNVFLKCINKTCLFYHGVWIFLFIYLYFYYLYYSDMPSQFIVQHGNTHGENYYNKII